MVLFTVNMKDTTVVYTFHDEFLISQDGVKGLKATQPGGWGIIHVHTHCY